MPSIEDWKKFKAVAQYRGVNAAAKALHFSPGAISTAVNRLEDELNQGPLFVRRTGTLTEAGLRWYEVAAACVDVLDGLTQRARTERGFRFVLGGSAYVMEHYMPYVLDTIRGHGGDVNFRLQRCSYHEIPELLRTGQIDLAVGPLSVDLPAHVECIRLVLLTPLLLIPDAPAFDGIRSTAQVFRQGTITKRLIVPPPDSPLTRSFDHYLRLNDVAWPDRDVCDEVGWIPQLVQKQHGFGLSLDLPSLHQRPGIRSLSLRGIAGIEYGLLWHRATRDSAAPFRRAAETAASRRFRFGRNGKVLTEHPPASGSVSER